MKKVRLFFVLVVALGIFLPSVNVFATNPYGIEYTGGEELGASNVVEDLELIDELTPVITTADSELTFQGQWEDAYIKDGSCIKVKYFTVSQQNLFNTANDYSYSVQRGQYKMDVKIKNVVGEYTTNGNVYMVGVPVYNYLSVGNSIYEDANCEDRKSNINNIDDTDDKLFVELDIKLYKDGQIGVFASDGLYFVFLDIDANQSYKILNSTDKLTANKMYTKSLSALQPMNSSVTAKNMFNANGNYIYSGSPAFNLTSGNNLYVKISTTAQQDGLGVVFGFNNVAAGSGIEYYAKQYTVTYESDEGGVITGITTEDVISGDTPSGSVEESKEDYELDYWETDKDVTLTDGAVIKAGEPITIEQIKKVVVNEDLTFTAIHKTKIKVPNTGIFTEDINGMFVSLPIVGISLGALMIGLLPRLARKKISFKK